MRLVFEGKAKCDDVSRGALAFIIEYHENLSHIIGCGHDPSLKGIARCATCGFYYCHHSELDRAVRNAIPSLKGIARCATCGFYYCHHSELDRAVRNAILS